MWTCDVVEQERRERKDGRGRWSAKSQKGLWKWRLMRLLEMREAKWLVYKAGWLRHGKKTLTRELISCERAGFAAEVAWGV